MLPLTWFQPPKTWRASRRGPSAAGEHLVDSYDLNVGLWRLYRNKTARSFDFLHSLLHKVLIIGRE